MVLALMPPPSPPSSPLPPAKAHITGLTEVVLAGSSAVSAILDRVEVAISAYEKHGEMHVFITMQLYRSTGRGREAISGILTFASVAQATLAALGQYAPSATPKASSGTRKTPAGDSDEEGRDDDDGEEDGGFGRGDEDEDGPPRLVSGPGDGAALVSVVRTLAREGGSTTMTIRSTVSYRACGLTLVLRSALGGNCKTSIVLTLARDPEMNQLGHLLLKFAVDARQIMKKVTPSKSFLAQRALLLVFVARTLSLTNRAPQHSLLVVLPPCSLCRVLIGTSSATPHIGCSTSRPTADSLGCTATETMNPRAQMMTTTGRRPGRQRALYDTRRRLWCPRHRKCWHRRHFRRDPHLRLPHRQIQHRGETQTTDLSIRA